MSIQRLVATLLAAAAPFGAVACDDDGDPLQPPDSRPADDMELPWWTPVPGEAKAWDIQLAAPFDTTPAHAMYVLDLWDVTDARTLTYTDGDVSVPAGQLADEFAALKARTPRPILVCLVDTGAIRLTDPDAMKFPGFEASPPDNPDAPAAGSVIGWSTSDGRRYLDHRAASVAMWAPLIEKRIQLAKDLGCDAISAHHSDPQTSGFTVEGNDVVARLQQVAMQVHARELSAGMHATTALGLTLSEGVASTFDWILVERCAEFDECDKTQPFTNLQKAAFALDYNGAIGFDLACQRQVNMQDGIHKDDPPDGDYRMECP